MWRPATDVGDGSPRSIDGGKDIPALAPTPIAAAVATATRATVVIAIFMGDEDVLLFFFMGDDVAVVDYLRGEAGRFSP